ncbi:MAG: inositol monophosphatase [Actinobacteria bacterium]|nr:inositol monophosphatase [Actinomycetota bacterium]
MGVTNFTENARPQDLLALALRIALEAGTLLMDRPASFEVSSKSTAIDIATQMDRASEKFIVESLLASRPNDGIIGEEGSSRASTSGLTWVIDPVDGTVNYLYGIPGWNVSIAVKDERGVIAGVVHSPTINSTFTAIRGGGAFLNSKEIHCNDPISLDLALIGTGFAYDVRRRVEQGRIVAQLLPQIRDLRRLGSAAIDICYVALGAFDGYFEYGLFEWDSAAAGLIATEAGAVITTDLRGVTVCAGPFLHPALATAVEGEI